jgi:hypothetical protein
MRESCRSRKSALDKQNAVATIPPLVMGFDSGSISFRRFAVVGPQPDSIDQALLDKLAGNTLRPPDAAPPQDIEYGFSGGRHIFDDSFSFQNNVFAEALHFALRIDTNKVPPEVIKAYKLIEEDAAAKENPSGFISKRQRQIARETAQRHIEDELRSGKYRRSRLVPILWDFPSAMLYCNPNSKSEQALHEIFDRVLDLELVPLSSGRLAHRFFAAQGKNRDVEDVKPTRFVVPSEDENKSAEYPWVAKAREAKDFLGNEFLVWLWNQAFAHEGALKTDGGELTVFFDKLLDLDCCFGNSGRDILRGDGVTRMPEAMDGLRSGKVPRKAGLIIESAGSQFTLTLSGESLGATSLQLPKVEDADNPRVLFEERVDLLRDLCKAIDSLYMTFLKLRTSSGWEGHVGAIRKWIMHSTRRAELSAT